MKKTALLVTAIALLVSGCGTSKASTPKPAAPDSRYITSPWNEDGNSDYQDVLAWCDGTNMLYQMADYRGGIAVASNDPRCAAK